MSRRETRDYDSKRHRSRFDREPSPKRSRRDRTEDNERIPNDSDARPEHKDQEKLRKPREAPMMSNSKEEPLAGSKESAKRTDDAIDSVKKIVISKESDKKANDQKPMPSERSYFQHDERASTRQVERDSRGRTTSGRGWWKDSKDHHHDGREVRNESRNRDIQYREDRSQKSREIDDRVWRHDGFSEMKANPSLPPPPPPPERKRPAFSEKRLQPDPESVEKIQTDHTTHERREERGRRNEHQLDRSERPFARDRFPANRGEERRFSTSGDNRYGRGGGNYRGRERNDGRSGYNPSNRVDKWKHDMFHEANRSPTPKKEEDHIAKVEALLAS